MGTDANQFNRSALLTGKIQPEHVTELARFYQAEHDLVPDGKVGPVTIARLEAEPSAKISLRALEDVGKDRTEMQVPWSVRNWCAWGVSLWLRDAGLSAPVAGSKDELVAKRLCQFLRDQGWKDVTWQQQALQPDDVVFWNRGLSAWQGHAEVVQRVSEGVWFVGANVSGKVKLQRFDVSAWPHRLKGVHAVLRRD